MAWIAAAVIGSAVVGGVMSSNAAGSAADAQVQAANSSAQATLQGTRETNEMIQKQYDQNRADQMPWMDAGRAALGQQTQGLQPGQDFNRDFTLADFARDPGAQYRFDQGREAVEGSAASRGMLLSGGTLKALTRYGQDEGSREFSSAYNRWNADRDRRFNRLAGVAGTGQTTAQQVGAAGATAAGEMGRNTMEGANSRASSYIQSGNARAAGAVGSANAWTGAIGNAVNGFQSQYYLNRMFPQPSPSGTPFNGYQAPAAPTQSWDATSNIA